MIAAAVLTNAEQAALAVFRSFLVNPGEMLCFHGPQLEKHGRSLRVLTEKNLIVKEQFAGGYSLTAAGFAAASERAAVPVGPSAPSKPSAASQSARRR